MNNEMVVLSPDDILKSGINSFDEKNLPDIIAGQVKKLNELDQSVRNAMAAADKAKDAARTAKNKSAGLFQKKEAIEVLQSSGVVLAEAVQSSAEAQKLSFEFQTKLAEITKYLFGLGVSNIASNRFVVRELEMKLKGASKEELSELAKQELFTVVKQLKEQEDMMLKQANLSNHVKTHEDTLKKQDHVNQEVAATLHAHSVADKQLGDNFESHVKDNQRLEAQLQAQAELDRLHSEQLQAHAEVDRLHAEQIKLQAETDKKLAEKLLMQEAVDRSHEEQFRIHAETDRKFKDLLETQAQIDKVHDEKLGVQAGRITDSEEQISMLIKRCDQLEEQLESSCKIIGNQENAVSFLQTEIKRLESVMATKAANSALKIAFSIASIACIVASIGFFM